MEVSLRYQGLLESKVERIEMKREREREAEPEMKREREAKVH